MRSVSVIVPVKDGARRLGDVLRAVRSQGEVELLVIDSGSRDGSLEIAREHAARVHAIGPGEFGHGRTRNLGAELTEGELIVFLTQDAVPVPGWLDALRGAFDLDEHVGAAYGPHLPWPDTSPMIARELEAFFAGMAGPDGGPALHREGDIPFLSNANAAYLRECWAEIRFGDLPYAEDQAFGAAMLAAGWVKAYHPDAAVLHAHDYGPLDFARRYFDEYRGIRRTVGHTEPAHPARVARDLRDAVVRDRRWMAERGLPASARARWTARSLVHHSGRKAAAVLATRVPSLPPALERRLSLEESAGTPVVPRTGDAGPPAAPRGVAVPARLPRPHHGDVLELSRGAAAALDPLRPGASRRERLHLAFVIPPFTRGGGGHASIFNLIARLEGMGHTCTIWVHDADGRLTVERPAVVRANIRDWFTPLRAPVYVEFGGWHGADVVVATGWDTVHPAARLPGCGARAYLVHDHEPDFFAVSAERSWAEATYEMGFYPICGSRWLRDLVAERYGRRGAWFEFGVDHATYRPLPVPRRRDTVICYARAFTPRRAVPLAMLALDELVRRMPGARVVLFGQGNALATSFSYELLGVASPGQLAAAYSEATVGLCLSLTNYSLIPNEMLACGLPCVDLAGGCTEAVFGTDGPVALAEHDPLALADAIERLMADEPGWRARSQAGLDYARHLSWDRAASQVEAGLRAALAERETAS